MILLYILVENQTCVTGDTLFVIDVAFLFLTPKIASCQYIKMSLYFPQDYGITKGYLAENLVAQEFATAGVSRLHSWTEGTSEIEFIRVIDNACVPVEVKSGIRTQAKSLRQYILKYLPKRAVKISGKPLSRIRNQAIQNYPLYLAARI